MFSISRDVLDYSILPYLTFEDLIEYKDKNWIFEAEYQRRIQDLLENGKDYEILIGALETTDPNLINAFYADLSTREELEDKLRNTIVDSLLSSTRWELGIAYRCY